MATEELSTLGAVIKEAYEGEENTNAYTDFDKQKVQNAAPLASPAFTGNPTAPTPTAGDNDTSIATTAFVADAISTAGGSYAPLASPAFTGSPTAPTPTAGDSDTSIATTAFVANAVTTGVTGLAPLASPALTGNPTAPTPTAGDNDTSIATTAFVANAVTTGVTGLAPLASPALTGNPTAPTATEGDNDTSIATTAFVANAVKKKLEAITVAASDESTALTAGTNKVTFRMPYAFTLTGVKASVNTAPTGASLLTVDVNEGGVSILSTKLTFDASEKTTVTAATPPVISDASLAADAEISVDVDQIGSTIAGAGLKVTLLGYQT